MPCVNGRHLLVEEECVVGTRITHEPLHCLDHVRLGGDGAGVARVVGENDHVVGAVSVAIHQELLDVVHIINAPAQCVVLASVVDTNQESLALSGTCNAPSRHEREPGRGRDGERGEATTRVEMQTVTSGNSLNASIQAMKESNGSKRPKVCVSTAIHKPRVVDSTSLTHTASTGSTAAGLGRPVPGTGVHSSVFRSAGGLVVGCERIEGIDCRNLGLGVMEGVVRRLGLGLGLIL